MNCLIIFIFCFCVQVQCNHNLKNYLQKRFVEFQEKLQENEGVLEIEDVNVQNKNHLVYNQTNVAFPFNFLNKTFILINQQLHYVDKENNIIASKPFINEKNILFIRAVEFNGKQILLVAENDTIIIYEFLSESDYSHLHSIYSPHIVDAIFFTNSNDLFLIVAKNQGESLTQGSIYKLMSSHFDEVGTIFTKGATKLLTFTSNDREMIIVLQSGLKTSSSLYEFKSNVLRRIQKIATKNPKDLVSYIYEEKRYIAIFSDGSYTLYIWDGNELYLLKIPDLYLVDIVEPELLEWISSRIANFDLVTIINNNIPVIAALQNNKISFGPANNQLKFMKSMEFNNRHTNLTPLMVLQTMSRFIIISTDETKAVNIDIVTISVELSPKETKLEIDEILHCFTNLEKLLFDRRSQLKKLTNKTKRSLQEDKSSHQLDDINLRMNKTQGFIDDFLIDDRNELIVDREMVHVNDIKANMMKAKNIDFEVLNNANWKLETFLSYTKDQIISGFVTAEHIQANKVEKNESSNDLLQFADEITVRNLSVRNIHTTLINNIFMNDIYLKSDASVRGLKRFMQLHVEKATINQEKFDRNLQVDNLVINTIDNVNWETFKSSLFRTGVTKNITGNLKFTSITSDSLNPKKIGGSKNMNAVFTVTTNQTVSSSIKFTNILAKKINTTTVNNIDFKNSVAAFDSFVKGPVKIDNVTIDKKLHILGPLNQSFFIKKEQHIVGTNESDLLQLYNTVKIKGNLFLNNLYLDDDAQLMLIDDEIDRSFTKYWTKDTIQSIPSHFEAHKGVKCEHLRTKTLNGLNMDDYMLNSVSDKPFTRYSFENVTVFGDIILNKSKQHTPDLKALDRESVKTNGSFKIDGKKNYTNLIKVDEIVVDQINEIDVSTLPTMKTTITGDNLIENLVIKQNLFADKCSTNIVNDVNLEYLQNNALYIDQNTELPFISAQHITVVNLEVSEINDRNLSEHIAKIDNLYQNPVMKNLVINGDVEIENIRNLETINDNKHYDHINEMVNYKDGSVYGNIKFLGNVKVENLIVSHINDVNLDDILYKNWYQLIKEHATFTNVKTDNLNATLINGKNVTQIVRRSSDVPQTIDLPNGLRIKGSHILKELNGTTPCALDKVLIALRNPQIPFWKNMIIAGNVTIWDETSALNHIFTKSVLNSTNNIITGKVVFIDNLLADNVTSHHINNVCLGHIYSDAVLTDVTEYEQIITGFKTFPQIQAMEVENRLNIYTEQINEINVTKVDRSIVEHPNQLIKGRKTFFKGLQVAHLFSDRIAGVNTSNLVNVFDKRKINGVFTSLAVKNNLYVKSINNVNFEQFLLDRLLIDSLEDQIVTGDNYFENLELKGDVHVSTINELHLANVVIDDGTQNISSIKKFRGNLVLDGNLMCDYLNGLQISVLYERAIVTGEPLTTSGVMTFLQPSIMNGNIITEKLNGFDINGIMQTINKETTKAEVEKIYNISDNLRQIMEYNVHAVQNLSVDISYFEKSENIQISLRSTLNARTLKIGDNVLIHIDGEENADYCGLPSTCKCSVQHTLQITPQHSIDVFVNKGSQRIFTYSDNEIIAHLVTNSISRNSVCRTDTTKILNEISTLTWNRIPSANYSGSLFMHPEHFTGYISGAEFFTLNGKTYIVVGRFYDPVVDTHDLDCIILRFNTDKTKPEVIQRIPTRAAWTISLLYTAQGIILIIGSDENVPGAYTQILRFNPFSEQFDLLRNINYGCSFSAGVVIEYDSLIVLASKHSPLQIFKYSSEFENYYFYQSFHMNNAIVGLSVFYTGGFGISDAFLCVATENSNYFVYSYRFIEGWKLEFSGKLDGISSLVSFELDNDIYLLAPSKKNSVLLSIVMNDSN